MRIVFMGTPQLAAAVLEGLAERHDVVGVFTRPDAIRGRGKKLLASPVKITAEKLGLNVYTPKKLSEDASVELVKSLEPDVICVAAFGCLLPESVLELPVHSCLNVHTSLLPRWRGAAPIERAILSRDRHTGVCIMRMEEGLDTGPCCARKTVPIGDKYLSELTGELAMLGTEALLESLDRIADGSIEYTPQPTEGQTYAAKLEKGELDFALEDTADLLCAKVRASSDSHPSRILIAQRRVAVERARTVSAADGSILPDSLAAGSVAFAAKRLLIGTADGAVELEWVKPEGKKRMEGRAFAAGIQGIKNSQVTWGRI